MRQIPRWEVDIDDIENYDPLCDGVVGDFETALTTLLQRVKDKEGAFSPTLLEWDRLRGNDWFTGTKREVLGTYGKEKEEKQ